MPTSANGKPTLSANHEPSSRLNTDKFHDQSDSYTTTAAGTADDLRQARSTGVSTGAASSDMINRRDGGAGTPVLRGKMVHDEADLLENGDTAFTMQQRQQQPLLHDSIAVNGIVDGTAREGAARDGKLGVAPPAQLSARDKKALVLLIALYLLQGVPVGLAFGSIPFLLRSKLSYSQIGIFTLCTYPYSLKLLWSPIVDSIFSQRLGRRKSWIVPVQTIVGVLLWWLSSNVQSLMDVEEPDVNKLTVLFFSLVFFAATQDIAVDGWALTLLSKENLSYASTTQTIGLNTGYFLSFTVLLAFNSVEFSNKYFRSTPLDYPLVTLSGYLRFWGVAFVVVTSYLAIFQPENAVSTDDPDMDLKKVYNIMWDICKLKHIQSFVVIHLVAKLGTAANDAATSLKLLEKGLKKEDLALAVLIDFPFQILFGYLAGKWSQGERPLRPWLIAMWTRLVWAVAAMLLIHFFPQERDVGPFYFFLVVFCTVGSSFSSTVQFVGISAFHSQIADPLIGGTYMTLLNTVSNLGGTWPRYFVLKGVDAFSEAVCVIKDQNVDLTIETDGAAIANRELLDADQHDSGSDERAQQARLVALSEILDEFQEQAYLLDAELESLIKPIVAALCNVLHQNDSLQALHSPCATRLSSLVYQFIKVRGSKVIAQSLPTETTSFVALISVFSKPTALDSAAWQTRFVLLLWLSVAIRLPFALAKAQVTDDFVPSLANRYMTSSGKERDGAITLLVSFYTRPDSQVQQLLAQCEAVVADDHQGVLGSPAAVFAVLAEVIDIVGSSTILIHWSKLYKLLALSRPRLASAGPQSHKLWVKLSGRTALLKLSQNSSRNIVPDEVEAILQDLLDALSASDTIVRWSTAKYIARIAQAVTFDMKDEIVSAVIEILEASLSDLDSPERGTQGACFALGELGRHGCLASGAVNTAIPSILEALVFDRRRGKQSIGSGVRDAAAYVLWSTSRSTPANAFEPENLDKLAERLACVACFDREVQVRRAASAAFQECAGRWQTRFPHGLDTLRKIDFVTVGVQSRAFLEAAPAVATVEQYRQSMLEFLQNRSLVHYDVKVRSLAAECLARLIAQSSDLVLVNSLGSLLPLSVKDMTRLHGQLMALAWLIKSMRSRGVTNKDEHLQAVRTALNGRGAPLIVLPTRRSSQVLFKSDLRSQTSLSQTFAAQVLGTLLTNESGQLDNLHTLIEFLTDPAAKRARPIEARRNAIKSLSQIATRIVEDLDSSSFDRTIHTCLAGVDDYSVDQRGDVGSWVRIACLDALAVVGTKAFTRLSQEVLDKIVAAALKQAVEPLDSVREAAARCLSKLATETCDFDSVELRERDRLSQINGNTSPLSGTSPLFEYASDMIAAQHDELQYELPDLIQDLTQVLKAKISSNRFCIHAAALVCALMDSGLLTMLDDESTADVQSRLLALLRAFHVGLGRIKSEARLKAIADVSISFLSLPAAVDEVLEAVQILLSHSSSAVRHFVNWFGKGPR
ncbi:hypothetical protein OIO90_005491 [Microbotryomycetes sp. JL221]|nr:hypothetical protein OIO90_005491 [Microbotryomycetes sp. JL221]